MTRTLIKTAFSGLALGVLAASAHAGHLDRGYPSHPQMRPQSQAYIQQINARQARQMRQIEAARRAGLLSRYEFRALRREQRQIRAMEHRFRADGILNGHEFQHLDRALRLAQRSIRRETLAHNTHPGYGHVHDYN